MGLQDLEEKYNLIETQFPSKIWVKDFSIDKDNINIILIENLQTQKLQKWQYSGGKWKQLSVFYFELKGNVALTDFLIHWNQEFRNKLSAELLKRKLHSFNSITVFTSNDFNVENQLNIMVTSIQNKEKKATTFFMNKN